jgi:glycosyltransferase involved in cell wall biosynthesis
VSAAGREPLISICVPTHQGRREVLSELLEGIIEQAREMPGQVEICVSDNASSDGTAELLDDISRRSLCPVVYHRQAEDTGLAPNLLASVEIAHGRYCWLLGSDDLLAPGALRRARALIERLPDATGYVVGATHVDAENPRLRSRALPREFHPPGGQPRMIEGIDRVYDECGNAWCALSWTIVDRRAWLQVARGHTELVLAHPVFPQVVLLATVAAERPQWGWLAESLVRQRNATTFLFEQGDVLLADRWCRIIDGVAAAWGAVLGPRVGNRWRRRMQRVQRVWGSTADMRATKLYESPPLRSQARLALACLKAFWPVAGYWRDVLRATLTPSWLTRARYGARGRSRGSRESDSPQLGLSTCLPARVTAGSVGWVEVEVRNEGRRTILPDGPRAVTIAQRWSTAEGEPLDREKLELNELAAMPQSLPRAIRGRRALSVDVSLYAPTEPGRYRLEVVAHQHGRGWLEGSPGSRMLSSDVEVVSRGDDVEVSARQPAELRSQRR